MSHSKSDARGVVPPRPCCGQTTQIGCGALRHHNAVQPHRSRLVSFVALAALGCVLGCSRRNAPESAPIAKSISVRVSRVSSDAQPSTEEVVGTVRARLRSSVEAKVAGRIQVLPVVPGQLVRKGDTVAVLDGREIRARLDSAQAVLEQASRDLTRTSKLTKEGAATAVEADAMQVRQRIAAASVVEAETLLEHTRVVAPFDGVITRKLADVGDLASPGRTIVEIEDPAQLRFEADLPEALIDGIKLGSQLFVRLSSSDIQIPGVVSEIAPMAETASRTYLVKLDLPRIPAIRAGQFGRVAVPAGENHVPRIPASAIVQRGQLEYVFVVDSGKVQLRLIRSGKRLAAQVEVVSGLNPGELVVAAKPEELREGQPVEAIQ